MRAPSSQRPHLQILSHVVRVSVPHLGFGVSTGILGRTHKHSVHTTPSVVFMWYFLWLWTLSLVTSAHVFMVPGHSPVCSQGRLWSVGFAVTLHFPTANECHRMYRFNNFSKCTQPRLKVLILGNLCWSSGMTKVLQDFEFPGLVFSFTVFLEMFSSSLVRDRKRSYLLLCLPIYLGLSLEYSSSPIRIFVLYDFL